jgi:hypothetical protein
MIKYIKHFFIIFVLLVSLPLFGHVFDSDTINRKIILQATIEVDNTIDFSGTLTMDIGFYTKDKNSDPLWCETFGKEDSETCDKGTNKKIKFLNGTFTQELGTLHRIPPNIFVSQDVRIGITTYSDEQPNKGNTVFLPLSAVPYAFHSEVSNTARRLADEDVMKFDTLNKRVGIGILSPSEALDVSGNVQAVKFIGDGSGLTNVSSNTDELVWKLTPNQNIYYKEGGFVGIGTETPTRKLEVSGNVLINGDLIVKGTINANQLTGDGAGITNLNASKIETGLMHEDRIRGNYSNISGLGTITSGTWNATPISDEMIDNQLTLDGATIRGTNTISGNITLTGPTHIIGPSQLLDIKTSNWELTKEGTLHLQSIKLNNQLLITKNHLEILSNDGLHIHPTGKNGLFISQDGHVGIGTTTPRSLLDINGPILVSATATEVEGTIRYQNGYFEGYGQQSGQSSPTWHKLDYNSSLDSHALHAQGEAILDLIYVKSNGNIGIGGIPSNNITDDIVISGNVVMTESDTASPLTKSGAGTRMMWVPGKAAFRAGIVRVDQWNDTNIGQNSVVFGDSGLADAENTVIVGGKSNINKAEGSVIVGGYNNKIEDSKYSVIVGGGFLDNGNSITGSGAHNTILGGYFNAINDGSYSSIIGGHNNYVQGNNSVAIGSNIQILHSNSFVFSDSLETRSTTDDNQFLIYAEGGVGINTAPSTTMALTVSGDVKASYFYGDGSTLTNVDAYQLNGRSATTNRAENSIYISDSQGFLPSNTIDSDSIVDQSITDQDIADGTITSKNIASNAITNSHIADNTITSAKINDGAITGVKIQKNAISSKNIRSGSISSANIAENTIQTHHIVNNAITNDKIALNTITSDHIVDGTITSQDIKAGSIASQNIAENAIQSHHIAEYSVGSKNIQPNAIQSHHLTDLLILPEHISNDAILSRHISPNAISSSHISDYAILSQHISSNVITSSKIKDYTIPSKKIALNSISSEHISPNSILSHHISPNAILSHHISPNTIISDHISPNAITSLHIKDYTITSADIEINTITSKNIMDRSISGDDFMEGTFPSFLLAPNTITSKNIKPYSIVSRNIAENTISSRNIQDNSIEASHIQDFIISSDMISIGAIKTEHIATNAIQAHHITKNAITSENIAAGTLTWEHIITPSVLPLDHIADHSISGEKIATGSITSKNIADNSIYAKHIAAGAITPDKIDGTFGLDQGGIGDMLSGNILIDGGIVYTKMLVNSPNLTTTPHFIWESNQLRVGSPNMSLTDATDTLIVSGNVNIQNGSLKFGGSQGLTYANKQWSISDSTVGFLILGHNLQPISRDTAPTGGLKTSKLYVSEKLGVGILDPENTVDVLGNMSIGYTGEMAPANGLLVKGKVGIGTNSPDPAYQMHVSGNIITNGIAAEGSGGIGIQTMGGHTGIIATGNTQGIVVTATQTGIDITASSNAIIVTLTDPINDSTGVKSTILDSGGSPTAEGSLSKWFSRNAKNIYASIYGYVDDPTNYAGYFDGPVYVSGNVGIGLDPEVVPAHALHVKGDIKVEGLVYTTANIVVGDDINWNNGNMAKANCDNSPLPLTFSNSNNLPAGSYFLNLHVTNTLNSSCLVSFSSTSINWQTGTNTAFSIPTTKTAIFSFYAFSDGSTVTYYGLPPMIF